VGLTNTDWGTRLPHDGRTIGASCITSPACTRSKSSWAWPSRRGGHRGRHTGGRGPDQREARGRFRWRLEEAALDLLRRNSAAAAAAIRALSDDELNQAATVSLYGDAPLTCRFFLEDHAVRHSYRHLAGIRRAMLQPA